MHKDKILAISKSDMLDDEMMEEMKLELPEGIETLFISAVAQQGITELNDLVWNTLNND